MTDARKPDICIYHAPCADGFAAAWAVWTCWPDVTFVPGVYGEAPPDVTGKHVLIVDFSYKRPVLEKMAALAASITILDHHKSAEADLAPFTVEALFLPKYAGRGAIQALFDMDRSGAMMAWDYCRPGTPTPRLIEYVQDRDLWRFALPGSREVSACLFSTEYDFAAWDDFARHLETEDGRDIIVAQGAAIERKHHKDVDELLGLTCRYMVIGGQRVPVANIPYTMASDAANQLAEGNAFAACYYDNDEGRRVFSLRSKAEGADVSLVAAGYGGGGHARAAGFSMPLGWEGDEGPTFLGHLVQRRGYKGYVVPPGQPIPLLTGRGTVTPIYEGPQTVTAEPQASGRDERFIPGMMRCAKCEFVLVRTNLYVGNGTTGPGDNKTEPCPNGCGPLWPMSWQQHAKDMAERCEAAVLEAADLRGQLAAHKEAPQPTEAQKLTHRFRHASDILEGMTDGIDGDRLGALIRWTRSGKIGRDERDALERIFAAPWLAAEDEAGWKGDARAEAVKDIARITAEAEALA